MDYLLQLQSHSRSDLDDDEFGHDRFTVWNPVIDFDDDHPTSTHIPEHRSPSLLQWRTRSVPLRPNIPITFEPHHAQDARLKWFSHSRW